MARICFDVDKLKAWIDWIMSYKILGIALQLKDNKLLFNTTHRSDPLEGIILEDETVQKFDNVDKAQIILELDTIEKAIDKLKSKLDNSIEFPDLKK